MLVRLKLVLQARDGMPFGHTANDLFLAIGDVLHLLGQLLLKINAFLALEILSHVVLVYSNVIDLNQDVPARVLNHDEATSLAFHREVQDILAGVKEVTCIFEAVESNHIATE